MKTKSIKRIVSLLMCLLLCMAMMGPALAFADGGGDIASDITIRITPPSGWATQQAEVEIRITDNTGSGFQTAQVKTGSSHWRDITHDLEQTENRYYCVVSITENCTVHVQVAGLDGKTYEKSQYIQCFNTVSDQRDTVTSKPDSPAAAGGTAAAPTSSAVSAVQPPVGQGTVVDNTTNERGREFFTIATQDDNTFYLVIDRQRDSENVYFLDTVKESDLLSLAEKDQEQNTQSAVPDPEPVCNCSDKCVPGEVKTSCPVCVLSLKDCTGKATITEPAPEAPAKEKSNSSTIIIAVIAMLAVGGAGYYLKIYKPKKDLDDAEDFDELIGEEETVNEDDMPAALEHVPYAEPEEPDYADYYGYEEPGDEE